MLLPRERQKQAYQKALVNRFKHMPEVSRITRHRHLPTVRITSPCAGGLRLVWGLCCVSCMCTARQHMSCRRWEHWAGA